MYRPMWGIQPGVTIRVRQRGLGCRAMRTYVGDAESPSSRPASLGPPPCPTRTLGHPSSIAPPPPWGRSLGIPPHVLSPHPWCRNRGISSGSSPGLRGTRILCMLWPSPRCPGPACKLESLSGVAFSLVGVGVGGHCGCCCLIPVPLTLFILALPTPLTTTDLRPWAPPPHPPGMAGWHVSREWLSRRDPPPLGPL
jgi:hypothetical protein